MVQSPQQLYQGCSTKFRELYSGAWSQSNGQWAAGCSDLLSGFRSGREERGRAPLLRAIGSGNAFMVGRKVGFRTYNALGCETVKRGIMKVRPGGMCPRPLLHRDWAGIVPQGDSHDRKGWRRDKHSHGIGDINEDLHTAMKFTAGQQETEEVSLGMKDILELDRSMHVRDLSIFYAMVNSSQSLHMPC